MSLARGESPRVGRIVDQLIKADLNNVFDIYYTGKVYMGENREELNVLFDTASDWFMLEVHTCAACDDQSVYNYADESTTTFSIVSPREEQFVRISDQGWVQGFAVTDRVCLEDK